MKKKNLKAKLQSIMMTKETFNGMSNLAVMIMINLPHLIKKMKKNHNHNQSKKVIKTKKMLFGMMKKMTLL